MPSMLTVVGARPQFVKAMLLSELFSEERDIEEVVVHTGQHYDVKCQRCSFGSSGCKRRRTSWASTGEVMAR